MIFEFFGQVWEMEVAIDFISIFFCENKEFHPYVYFFHGLRISLNKLVHHLKIYEVANHLKVVGIEYKNPLQIFQMWHNLFGRTLSEKRSVILT